MALTKISRSLLDTGVSDSSDATAITIDSSENVGIANTSPVSKLDVTHTITSNTGDSIASFGTSGSGGWANSAHQVIVGGPSLSTYTGLIIFSDSASGNGQLSFADGKGASDSWRGSIGYNHASDFMTLATNASEAIRILSNQQVLIGSQSESSYTAEKAVITGSSYSLAVKVTAASGTMIRFVNGTSTSNCGQVYNNTTTSVIYATTSDYREKENVKPMQDGLNRVMKLNPVKYNWKQDGVEEEGFIAHEVQDAGWNVGIKGQKDDEERQMMEYGRMTPLLVKAIQEQQEQIESLQQEIEVLKNGN